MDNDLQFAEGKGEEFLARLQARLGIGADQLHKTLNDMKHEVEEAAGTVHGTFENAKHKVSEVAHDVSAKVAEVAHDVTARVTEVAGNLKAGAVEQAEHLKQKAGEVYDDACHTVRSWHEEGENYVRAQPRTALLSALVAGFMLGLLIRR